MTITLKGQLQKAIDVQQADVDRLQRIRDVELPAAKLKLKALRDLVLSITAEHDAMIETLRQAGIVSVEDA